MSKYIKFNPCPFCGKTDFELTPKDFYEELVGVTGKTCISLCCRTCAVYMYEFTDFVTYEDKVELLVKKWNRGNKR